MPPPPTVVECTANCCWDAALRMWLRRSDREPGAPASPNCWHEADLGMPTPPRWSRHRKEPGCVVGEHMHRLKSAGASPPLEAIPCRLDGSQGHDFSEVELPVRYVCFGQGMHEIFMYVWCFSFE